MVKISSVYYRIVFGGILNGLEATGQYLSEVDNPTAYKQAERFVEEARKYKAEKITVRVNGNVRNRNAFVYITTKEHVMLHKFYTDDLNTLHGITDYIVELYKDSKGRPLEFIQEKALTEGARSMPGTILAGTI